MTNKANKSKSIQLKVIVALPVRDSLMVSLINGATKSAVHKDQKKEASRTKCRKPITQED